MSEQQISKLASALVEHQNAFGSMSTDNRQWVIQNTKEAIALFAEAVKNRVGNVVQKLFEFVTTIHVAGVASFVAAKKFRPGKTIDGIKVGWLGDNFKEHFLPKVEKNSIAAEELIVNKLLKNSRDPVIITALGGEEKVEISLGQFWNFLKTADQQFWYVVYIRDTDDVLWAVLAYWSGGGLYVGARSLDSPRGWCAGYRFLSR